MQIKLVRGIGPPWVFAAELLSMVFLGCAPLPSGYTLTAHGSRLCEQVALRTHYPALALCNHWEGTAVLSVVVGDDLTPDSIKIVGSSGHRVLDEEAVKSVTGMVFSSEDIGTNTVSVMFKIAGQN